MWVHQDTCLYFRDVPSFGAYVVLYDSMITAISGSEENANAAVLIFSGGMAGRQGTLIATHLPPNPTPSLALISPEPAAFPSSLLHSSSDLPSSLRPILICSSQALFPQFFVVVPFSNSTLLS